MAWHDNGNRIRCTSAGHRANGSWPSNGASYFAISSRYTVRNPAQLFPHPPLERCSLNIRGQIEVWLFPTQMRENLVDPRFQTIPVAADLCARIFSAECGLEVFIRIAQIESANSSVRGADEEAPESASSQSKSARAFPLLRGDKWKGSSQDAQGHARIGDYLSRILRRREQWSHYLLFSAAI